LACVRALKEVKSFFSDNWIMLWCVAADGVNDLFFFGTKPGGGVDRIYHSGGWWTTETDIVSETYISITADAVNDYFFYGA
jgi:hypothetical protein